MTASPVLPRRRRAAGPHRREPITSRSTCSDSASSAFAGRPRVTSTWALAPVALAAVPSRPRTRSISCADDVVPFTEDGPLNTAIRGNRSSTTPQHMQRGARGDRDGPPARARTSTRDCRRSRRRCSAGRSPVECASPEARRQGRIRSGTAAAGFACRSALFPRARDDSSRGPADRDGDAARRDATRARSRGRSR